MGAYEDSRLKFSHLAPLDTSAFVWRLKAALKHVRRVPKSHVLAHIDEWVWQIDKVEFCENMQICCTHPVRETFLVGRYMCDLKCEIICI